jgi:hypothetical protein
MDGLPYCCCGIAEPAKLSGGWKRRTEMKFASFETRSLATLAMFAVFGLEREDHLGGVVSVSARECEERPKYGPQKRRRLSRSETLQENP